MNNNLVKRKSLSSSNLHNLDHLNEKPQHIKPNNNKKLNPCKDNKLDENIKTLQSHKQNRGCFGCLSKKSLSKNDLPDETLNNLLKKNSLKKRPLSDVINNNNNNNSSNNNNNSNILQNINNKNVLNSSIKNNGNIVNKTNNTTKKNTINNLHCRNSGADDHLNKKDESVNCKTNNVNVNSLNQGNLRALDSFNQSAGNRNVSKVRSAAGSDSASSTLLKNINNNVSTSSTFTSDNGNNVSKYISAASFSIEETLPLYSASTKSRQSSEWKETRKSETLAGSPTKCVETVLIHVPSTEHATDKKQLTTFRYSYPTNTKPQLYNSDFLHQTQLSTNPAATTTLMATSAATAATTDPSVLLAGEVDARVTGNYITIGAPFTAPTTLQKQNATNRRNEANVSTSCTDGIIYDSVSHFNKQPFIGKPQQMESVKNGDDVKNDDLNNIEFYHAVGREMIKEMDAEDFDSIQFACYRTAQKLNYIRKILHLNANVLTEWKVFPLIIGGNF
ncbi:hypothetical protein HELRODRAFT_158754 [Helobdella robusta]|uniref:Uncharacterized protein n=1 Tax=Helobdella robusta TaxID=6412 RepID=T1EN76_HELRO|nr:hypothetical protein HELRODRAFT_158754 [Helobdella robusta]ESO12273.1 hypothetical protein HELRODRAFT_158754 [Helobdella robusta]